MPPPCATAAAASSLSPILHRLVSWYRLSLAAGARWNTGASGVRHMSLDAYRATMDHVNELFAEAREEMSLARESAETLYFNEEFKIAADAVDQCLEKFDALKQSMDDGDRAALERAMGLKMEQLREEFRQLKELHS